MPALDLADAQEGGAYRRFWQQMFRPVDPAFGAHQPMAERSDGNVRALFVAG